MDVYPVFWILVVYFWKVGAVLVSSHNYGMEDGNLFCNFQIFLSCLLNYFKMDLFCLIWNPVKIHINSILSSLCDTFQCVSLRVGS